MVMGFTFCFSNGTSVLLCGVSNAKYDIVADLLDAGANINFRGTFKQKSALHMASELGDIKMVTLLLKYRPKLQLTDAYGKTFPFYVSSYPRSSFLIGTDVRSLFFLPRPVIPFLNKMNFHVVFIFKLCCITELGNQIIRPVDMSLFDIKLSNSKFSNTK